MKNKTKILAALLALTMLSTSTFCAFADETAATDAPVVTAADEVTSEAADTDADADATEADATDVDATDTETTEADAAEAADIAEDATDAEESDEAAADTVEEAAPVIISVDGEAITIEGAGEEIDGVVTGAKAEQKDGALMLPLRAICEKLGCAVEWYAAERQVVIVKDDTLRTITLDNAEMTTLRVLPLASEDGAMAVNKSVADLVPSPTLIGDLTYVPVAFFEVMGLTLQ